MEHPLYHQGVPATPQRPLLQPDWIPCNSLCMSTDLPNPHHSVHAEYIEPLLSSGNKHCIFQEDPPTTPTGHHPWLVAAALNSQSVLRWSLLARLSHLDLGYSRFSASWLRSSADLC